MPNLVAGVEVEESGGGGEDRENEEILEPMVGENLRESCGNDTTLERGESFIEEGENEPKWIGAKSEKGETTPRPRGGRLGFLVIAEADSGIGEGVTDIGGDEACLIEESAEENRDSDNGEVA